MPSATPPLTSQFATAWGFFTAAPASRPALNASVSIAGSHTQRPTSALLACRPGLLDDEACRPIRRCWACRFACQSGLPRLRSLWDRSDAAAATRPARNATASIWGSLHARAPRILVALASTMITSASMPATGGGQRRGRRDIRISY